MNYSSPVNKLLTYGDPRDFDDWPDYLKLGFTNKHIPELINLASETDLILSDAEEFENWATVHAWRVLGQLKAKEATKPLMNLFHELDDENWSDEELPTVFALIGASTLPFLARYLADTSHKISPRISAASCINEVGKLNKDVTENCIALLTVQLEKYEENPPELNGFLTWFLTDFKALDSLSTIKEAYQRECVDESLIGGFSNVEYELGLTDKPPQVQFFAEESTDESSDQFSASIQDNFDIDRNDPCPCGSGKKYKKCCLNRI
ncbi:SEC-C domain-containing protein [candidate division KSB1 bacterium]|nr:SEC-C domain-containing protein [candidate division KSB1 bacterium]